MKADKLDRDSLDHMSSCGFCKYSATNRYCEPCKSCISQGHSSYAPTKVPEYAKKALCKKVEEVKEEKNTEEN
jgi:hypothetical protein